MKSLITLANNRVGVLREILRHPLTADAKTHTLLRYGLWNISRYIVKYKVVIQMPKDLQLIVPNKANFATGLYLHQLYDLGNMAFFCHFMRKGSIFVDVGANVGVYGLLAAKTTGCHTIVCEPAADTFAILSDNVHLNRLDSLVELHNVAAGDETGQLLLSEGKHGLNHVVRSGGARVAQMRLDDIVGDRQPIAIKLDVEGYEYHVLRGAVRTLANPALKAVMVEINGLVERYGATIQDVRSQLREYGFSSFRYDPSERSLSAGTDEDELFIRDPDEVTYLVKRAPVLESHGKSF